MAAAAPAPAGTLGRALGGLAALTPPLAQRTLVVLGDAEECEEEAAAASV